jgi:hypothetical protein
MVSSGSPILVADVNFRIDDLQCDDGSPF